MAKFKVIALSVGGLKNKIYKSGEIVSADSFADANALVDAGFLSLIEEKKTAHAKPATKKKR